MLSIKKSLLYVGILSFLFSCETTPEKIKMNVKQSFFRPIIENLSDDRMMGREMGSLGSKYAAQMIMDEFETIGTHYYPGKSSYSQAVTIYKTPQLINASIELGKNLKLSTPAKLIGLKQVRTLNIEAEVAAMSDWDAEKASKWEYRDKMIVYRLSENELFSSSDSTFQTWLDSFYAKIVKADAKAAIVLLPDSKIKWNSIINRFNRSVYSLIDAENETPVLFVEGKFVSRNALKRAKTVKIQSESERFEPLKDQNITAYIPGSDSKFKNYPVLVTAHYDHIGYKKGLPADQDSIYNGARDNIVGVTAMLVGAKVLQKLSPKRPVLFIAFTGEEKGLLGSRFYAENPLFPLKNTYFGINLDNAGYNDTSIVSLIGLSNYKNDSLFIKPIQEMGLKALLDPVPQFRLFERSDNIILTQKGVPTMSYSLGFTDFTDELNKYYHQLADESSSLDYDYLERFYESFTNVLYYVANSEDPIEWREDSKWNPQNQE